MQNLIIINDEALDPHYINKLYVLLESLYIFSNINDATNILVPERYMNNIKNSNLYCSKILFTADLSKYNNIKYLDINTVIDNTFTGNNILQDMKAYLNTLKNDRIDNIIQTSKKYINDNLLPIIYNSNELLEGNMFMLHNTTIYTDEFINKQKNIVNLHLNKNIKNVLEIGFNAGFSALLILLTNPEINLTCVDLGEHRYTFPCYEVLKRNFGSRINIIFGDSTKILPKIKSYYDLIHIDGGHDDFCATNDIMNSYNLSKSGTILIMDDYNFVNLHNIWDKYIEIYNLKDLDINIYNNPYHDIKIVLK